jgi:hypothetical protein
MNEDTTPTIAVLLERVESLRTDTAEIKRQLEHLTVAFADRGAAHARENERVTNQATAAHRRLDIIEPKVDALEKMFRTDVQSLKDLIGPLRFQASVVTWFGAILGASVITLIWMIITGQVQLVFP